MSESTGRAEKARAGVAAEARQGTGSRTATAGGAASSDKADTNRPDNRGMSVAGVVIGLVGCVIITASSVYTALKMGSLPWPTIFTSITALVLLRALGHDSLHEANVTQIIMSAGSMVAGGLAFTIPGIWMLGLADDVSWVETLLVALAGTLLGLVATALIRKRMVDESDLTYPIGTAAAQTLQASKVGGRTGRRLLGSMAFAGVYSVLRDVAGVLPQMLLALPIPGVTFGIYDSPMMLSVGFLMGTTSIVLMCVGAVAGQLGIIVGAPALGLCDVATAQGVVSSLGMGLMMGSGLGVVCKDVIPRLGRTLTGGRRRQGTTDGAAAEGDAADPGTGDAPDDRLTDVRPGDRGLLALMVAAAALIICLGLGIGPVPCVVVVALSFVTCIMSAQSVGQTGIDPMEIFGLIVLLVVAALGGTSQVRLFFVAGVIAVACGIGGDVMSDFKTGAILGTDSRTMWLGQVMGALLGTVVATVTMVALVGAYGTDAFGPGQLFVSAQASVVATMVSGIPSVPAFVIGLAAGIALYCLGVPSMMLGLGVYLPFYMSLSSAVGALVKVAYDHVGRRGRDGEAKTAAAARTGAEGADGATGAADATAPAGELSHDDAGIVVASGLLGGESIVGVVIALVSVVAGLVG